MNQTPIHFSLKTKDKRHYFVFASCAEYKDKESITQASNQMLTQFDIEIFNKGLDAKSTASISIMPYKMFPDYQLIFEHNDYEPTENTEIYLRAFYTIEDEPNKVYPFYGQIVFEGTKVFFVEDPSAEANEKIIFSLSEDSNNTTSIN